MRAIGFSLMMIASGCGGLGDLFGNGTTTTDGGTTVVNPYTSPIVEITINGVHVGPAVPVSGASAAYANVSNGSAITSSTLSIVAATTGATCSFSLTRFASFGISPIGVGNYNVETAGDAITADGTVSPVGNITVTTAAGGFASCAGAACDGSGLNIQHVGADYIYGAWMGAVTTQDQSETDSVTCTFYLPTTSFQQ